MRFDANAGFTPAPEDDPLPALGSVPASLVDDLAYNLNGLHEARLLARAGLQALARDARRGVAAGEARLDADASTQAAARRRRVADWTRVVLQLAAAARLYDDAHHTPEHGLARAARFVALRASKRRLDGVRRLRTRPMPAAARRRDGS